ncbi:MAG: formylglycine-generating enzyme family protein [Chitinophagaceae bacterium]|nr:MAG: formylglycine-generating enzyme family protein [Chitinophagaceae bacterium]
MQHGIDLSEVDLNMVTIPKGEIGLRDDRIKKQWKVEIESFQLSKFLVTQDIYRAVMNESPSAFKGDRLPVENVSWKDAVLFCNTLSGLANLDQCYIMEDADTITYDATKNGFRLPTEAEWEYACKAGSSGIRYSDIDSVAWYKNNAEKSTRDVGLKSPNAWGLFDMLGNVWEWCSDVYDETVYGSYRIFRGGGWYDDERSVMATIRRRSHPAKFRIDDLGFRVARNIIS